MQMKLRIQKITAVFLALLLTFLLLPSVNSLQSKAFYGTLSKFNVPTLSGTEPEKLVQVARANNNRTESALGYDGRQWCVMFVSDCARLAGISTNIIPNDTSTKSMRDKLRKLGAKKVSQAQMGDIVIYYDKNGVTQHTAIATSSSMAINGNFKVNGAWRVYETKITSVECGSYEFYRPNNNRKPPLNTSGGFRSCNCSGFF